MSLLEDPTHPGEARKELYLDTLAMGAIAFGRTSDADRAVERRNNRDHAC